MLDSAPDAFVTLDADGVIRSWNDAAERIFGWTAAEAIGEPMRTLLTPPELRERHDERRQRLVEESGPEVPTHYEVELQRRDGSRFPAEATVSKVDVRGELLLAGFIRDVTDRKRQQDEREALVREQAARAEAERVAELVSGMQLLVDAALAHRTLDDILFDLVTRVRAVLDADAAAIYLAEDSRHSRWPPRPAARTPARPASRCRSARVSPAGSRPSASRCSSRTRRPPSCPTRRSSAGDRLPDRPAAAGGGGGDRGARRGRRRAAPLLRRRREPAAAGGRPGRARDRPRARVRARAQDRGDAAAQPAAGAPAAAAGVVGGGPLPARRAPRPRSAATGTTCCRPRAAASAW